MFQLRMPVPLTLPGQAATFTAAGGLLPATSLPQAAPVPAERR